MQIYARIHPSARYKSTNISTNIYLHIYIYMSTSFSSVSTPTTTNLRVFALGLWQKPVDEKDAEERQDAEDEEQPSNALLLLSVSVASAAYRGRTGRQNIWID